MLAFLCTAARVLSQDVSASIRTAITYANDIINKIYRVLGWPLRLQNVSGLQPV